MNVSTYTPTAYSISQLKTLFRTCVLENFRIVCTQILTIDVHFGLLRTLEIPVLFLYLHLVCYVIIHRFGAWEFTYSSHNLSFDLSYFCADKTT